MAGWICPDCGRHFRRRQSHECAPAMELDDYLATGPPFERPVLEAVRRLVDDLDGTHLEPVSVGVLVKRDGLTYLELRPMVRWMAVCFYVGRTVTSGRIARRPVATGRRTYHVVNVTDPAEVDDELAGWIREAWVTAG